MVEREAFIAWKDEAFSLWKLWALLYSHESPSMNLLNNIRESYYLVNLVDNNFKSQYALYDLLESVNYEISLQAGK